MPIIKGESNRTDAVLMALSTGVNHIVIPRDNYCYLEALNCVKGNGKLCVQKHRLGRDGRDYLIRWTYTVESIPPHIEAVLTKESVWLVFARPGSTPDYITLTLALRMGLLPSRWSYDQLAPQESASASSDHRQNRSDWTDGDQQQLCQSPEPYRQQRCDNKPPSR